MFKKASVIIGVILIAVVSWYFLSQQDRLTFVTEDYPPLNFRNEDGEVVGIAADIVTEIMKREGVSERINVLPWSEAYDMALHKKNVVIFSIRRTSEREDLFDWVGPILKTNNVLYTSRGSGVVIDVFDEAREVTAIGVVSGGFDEAVFADEGFSNLVRFATTAEVAAALARGDVDLALFNDAVAAEVTKEAGYNEDVIEPIFTVNTGYSYIGFSKGTPKELVAAWREALDAMKKDGTFADIHLMYRPSTDPSESF